MHTLTHKQTDKRTMHGIGTVAVLGRIYVEVPYSFQFLICVPRSLHSLYRTLTG
jgi:hypothetical protein